MSLARLVLLVGTPLLASALGCTCSGGQKAKAPDQVPGAKTAGGTREIEMGGGTRPPNSNPNPESARSQAGAVAMAVVLVGEKAVVVTESQRAVMRLDLERALWTGNELALSQNGGTRIWGHGDATWWQPSPAAGTVPLKDAVASAKDAATWLESETLPNGKRRIWATIDGKRERLGIFDADPAGAAILQSKPVPLAGKEAPRLNRSAGFSFGADGAPQAAPPKDATAQAIAAPSDAQRAAWLEELGRLRGGTITLTWASTLDLDRDGAAEGVACVAGGKDDDNCYVVEEVDGGRRYYGLGALSVPAGEARLQPVAFTLKEAPYLLQAVGDAQNPVVLVSRFDGGRYVTDSIK